MDHEIKVIEGDLKTAGVSPKAVLAFFFPLIAAAATAVINWASTGHFDKVSVVAAATGLGTSALGALGAYVGKPGTIIHTRTSDPEIVPAWPGDPQTAAQPDTADAGFDGGAVAKPSIGKVDEGVEFGGSE